MLLLRKIKIVLLSLVSFDLTEKPLPLQRTFPRETASLMSLQEAFDILIISVRDGFVQVSAFVAITVLLFSYIQYRTSGRIVTFLENHERMQPIAGALLGLTPGCGGAIVAMPLYIRGTISFGSVVATLAATAGDSAFVILAVAPGAAVYAYGLAFVSGICFGYAIDFWGLGLGRLDAAVERIRVSVRSNGFATSSVAEGGPSVPASAHSKGGSKPILFKSSPESRISSEGFATSSVAESEPRVPSSIPDGVHSKSTPESSSDSLDNPTTDRSASVMTAISHGVHILWWVVALAGLVAGVMYLVRGAPEVSLEFAPTFFGLFTVAGLLGTTLSFYLYFVGRRYISEGEAGRIRDSFGSAYETFQHAAMETAMVTVWVIAGYLLYEYTMEIFTLNIQMLAAAAGVFAPIAGALLGIVPGCAPQIVFAQLYALEEVIPFSALTANAISQDGDALFPLMAIDLKAAIIATIYTTIPALIVGALVYYFWPFARFGFGVIG